MMEHDGVASRKLSNTTFLNQWLFESVIRKKRYIKLFMIYALINTGQGLAKALNILLYFISE